MKIIFALFLAGVGSAGLAPRAQAAQTILVCYPGGPVDAAEAGNALSSMLRVVERVGQWKSGTFESAFTSRADECRKLLAERKPAFAITSLGLYLELASRHHLVPVVQPRIKGQTAERYRIMIKKGAFADLAALQGKTLGGSVLEETEYLRRIVFAGRIDPSRHFSLKPSRQALRSLRALAKGELDAVLVNQQQYDALGGLPFAKDLEAVFTSEAVPLMGLVADEKATSAGERERLTRALQGMCQDSEGKKLCELFGVESFEPVKPGTFDTARTLWEAGSK